jgi:predicted dehydrogenase
MVNFRIGIIGYGKMGKIRDRTIQKLGIGKVVSIYDPNESVSPRQGLEIKKSIEDVLNSSIDIVFICIPNHMIKEYTIKALNRGIHVFAEKPPGINLNEIKEINHVKNKLKDTRLMFGFNHRHHKSVKKMKEIIENKRLGKILWIRGRYGKEVDENYLKDWRANPEKSGGGIMLDQGIHLLDLFIYLGGEFDEIKSFVSNLYWKISGIEDNVFAIFRNSKSGLCASLHSTMTQWRYLFSLELFLEKGSLILNGLKTSSGAYGDEILTIRENSEPFIAGMSNKEKKYEFNEDVSWESEISHFIKSINEKKEPLIGNCNDALVLMKALDKIYKEN